MQNLLVKPYQLHRKFFLWVAKRRKLAFFFFFNFVLLKKIICPLHPELLPPPAHPRGSPEPYVHLTSQTTAVKEHRNQQGCNFHLNSPAVTDFHKFLTNSLVYTILTIFQIARWLQGNWEQHMARWAKSYLLLIEAKNAFSLSWHFIPVQGYMLVSLLTWHSPMTSEFKISFPAEHNPDLQILRA